MDKLKPYLAAVVKYQFWGLSALSIVVALVCWWMATGALADQFKKRKSAIDGVFRSAAVQPDHPNQRVIDEIKKQDKSLKEGVCKAWDMLYTAEKEKNRIPQEFVQEFQEAFKELKPEGEIRIALRELYPGDIKKYLPKLQTLVDARRPKDGAKPTAQPSTAPAGGNQPAKDIELIGTVDWNDNDYDKLKKRFEWDRTPSTLDIVLAQEDLWVYEALLRVIKNVNKNEGTTSHANAAIKRIDALDIGRDAAEAWGKAETPVFSAKGSSKSSLSGSNNGSSDQKLVDNRYVDDKGQPLPASQAKYPYARHPFAEFKMMPVRMSLVMDARKLPRLLVECGNSYMPLEVRRVRLLKTNPSSIDLASTSPGTGTSRGSGSGSSDSKKTDLEIGLHDIPVEIHAVLYIYNPPDREKLGAGAAASEK